MQAMTRKLVALAPLLLLPGFALSQNDIPLYEQCGGRYFTGSGKCGPGSYCEDYGNRDWALCVPDGSGATVALPVEVQQPPSTALPDWQNQPDQAWTTTIFVVGTEPPVPTLTITLPQDSSEPTQGADTPFNPIPDTPISPNPEVPAPIPPEDQPSNPGIPELVPDAPFEP